MPKKSRTCLPGIRPGTPKSLQKVSGAVWEVSGESPESVKRVFSDCSQDFLETFRGSGTGGRHFRDSFGISGPKGPRDLCKGRAGSQHVQGGDCKVREGASSPSAFLWRLLDRQINIQQSGVQSWSPFVTRNSGHIWRMWAEMTQMLMPRSTKVAQIHLPECNSAKIRQISAKFRFTEGL